MSNEERRDCEVVWGGYAVRDDDVDSVLSGVDQRGGANCGGADAGDGEPSDAGGDTAGEDRCGFRPADNPNRGTQVGADLQLMQSLITQYQTADASAQPGLLNQIQSATSAVQFDV